MSDTKSSSSRKHDYRPCRISQFNSAKPVSLTATTATTTTASTTSKRNRNRNRSSNRNSNRKSNTKASGASSGSSFSNSTVSSKASAAARVHKGAAHIVTVSVPPEPSSTSQSQSQSQSDQNGSFLSGYKNSRFGASGKVKRQRGLRKNKQPQHRESTRRSDTWLCPTASSSARMGLAQSYSHHVQVSAAKAPFR